MKVKDIKELQPGAKLRHNRYGIVEVEKIAFDGDELFGVIIVPETDAGKQLLMSDSGISFPRLLEDSPRQLKEVENC